MADIKIGDIFYASWGYDQTNIDFVQVIGISPSGKTAICKRATEKIVSHEDAMAETIVPGDLIGSSFRLKIGQINSPDSSRHGEIQLRGSLPDMPRSVMSFWKWDGKPLFQSHYH